MTREEAAIKSCEDRLKHLESAPTHHYGKRQRERAIELEKVKIKALRPVSREQVEKVFPGCPYCKPDSEGYVQKFGAYSILNGELKTGHCKPQKISFCPHCSRPLTDEAVEMVMEKINNMEEITNEH